MILADLLQKNVYPKIEMGRRDQLGRLEGPAAFVHIWYHRVKYDHTVHLQLEGMELEWYCFTPFNTLPN